MAYGICKICGCTDNDPCFNPQYGNCWWVDDTHELCSHCAKQEIADDPETIHCINSNDPCTHGLEEYLVCCHCTHWHNDNECPDLSNEDAFGDCDLHQYKCGGSETMCADFEEI